MLDMSPLNPGGFVYFKADIVTLAACGLNLFPLVFLVNPPPGPFVFVAGATSTA